MERGKVKLRKIDLGFFSQMITVTSYRHKRERFSYDLKKMVSVSVRYLFYQPMDEKIKTWTFRFPAKENPYVEKALFDSPIVLQYDIKAKYRLISRKFSLHQPKTTRVCICSINQSNRSISVPLLFLFCSCVFISRLYENRSKDLCPHLKVQDLYFVC